MAIGEEVMLGGDGVRGWGGRWCCGFERGFGFCCNHNGSDDISHCHGMISGKSQSDNLKVNLCL